MDVPLHASEDSSGLSLPLMELQSATTGLPGPLSPGPLSPTTSDYAGPLSPSSGGPGPSHTTSPGRGPSPSLSLSPVRGPSPIPGFSGQAAFNYNQLEGRFKQLQGKKEEGKHSEWCLGQKVRAAKRRHTAADQ